MQKQSRLLVFFALIFVVVLMTAACGESGDVPGADGGLDATPLPVAKAGNEVVAEGEVVPIRSVELKFEQAGTIEEVLVDEGSIVETDEPMARLDTRDLALAVEDAKANLAQAQADYDSLMEGATPEEIAAAEANVRQHEAEVARSQGDYARTAGTVTNSDIAAARAKVEQYREELARLEAGPKPTEIQESQATVDQAIANLQDTRNRLSIAKTKAYHNMEVTANRLRDAQDYYSSLYWDNREKHSNWDSPDANIDQNLREKEDQALRSVQTAEKEVENARLAYEEAQKAEIDGIAEAEAGVREAQARHEELLDGVDADEIAASRARLAQAEAELAKLVGQQRAGDLASASASIESAQSSLENARATLDNLTADPQSYELDRSLSLVRQREVALEKAELNLEKATLNAPFEGTVVEVNPESGEWFNTADVAFVLADFSEWEIETTDLDELEIVNVQVGDLARISFDALPGLELPGKVKSIQNMGKNYQGDIVYKVTIEPEQWDERLKWKMTATVAIESEDMDNEADADADADANGDAAEEETDTTATPDEAAE